MIKNFNPFNYNGPRMNPTLMPEAPLLNVPNVNKDIRVGDVVVIKTPEGNRHVTHRVVSVDSRGVRTRGDNNKNIDCWVLRREEITGRVDSALRGAKRVPIHGGRRGMMYASALRSIKRANLTISRILHPAHHRLAESGIFRRALQYRVRSQVLCFTGPNRIEMQLLMGRWIVGGRRPGWEQWQVRRPFRLFVDEASLPD